MRILVTGATGLIGSALCQYLTQKGDSVSRLVRSKKGQPQEILWNPVARVIDAKQLEGHEAVVHLAGDPIAKGRWNEEKKTRIRESRVKGTAFLSETLARLDQPPKTLVCASAIGIYGNRGDEVLTEESKPGKGFLADVGQEWEAASSAAAQRGIRIVQLRFGIVLSPQGGALTLMLPPFKLGLGGKLGSGQQYMSWISIADAVGAIDHALRNASISGPVNVVSPNPATNEQFTKELGRALHRPTVFPVPAFAAHLAFGELADEALLASTRVLPKKLQSSGYRFQHPDLETALRQLLS